MLLWLWEAASAGVYLCSHLGSLFIYFLLKGNVLKVNEKQRLPGCDRRKPYLIEMSQPDEMVRMATLCKISAGRYFYLYCVKSRIEPYSMSSQTPVFRNPLYFQKSRAPNYFELHLSTFNHLEIKIDT